MPHHKLGKSLPNLAILVGGKMEKIVQIQEKCKQQKNCQNFEISNLKEKKLLLMSKSFKIILIKH
jgi:hypothetical protein